MCAIVDNDVSHQVFGNGRTEAGQFFLDWLTRGNGGILVAGGKLLTELSQSSEFTRIFSERLQAGRARIISDESVNADEDELRAQGLCKSNDAHVLALARVSGARLLFTNDRDLQDDFRDRGIVGGTRGRIYTTREYQDVRNSHRSLLSRDDLCNV